MVTILVNHQVFSVYVSMLVSMFVWFWGRSILDLSNDLPCLVVEEGWLYAMGESQILDLVELSWSVYSLL